MLLTFTDADSRNSLKQEECVAVTVVDEHEKKSESSLSQWIDLDIYRTNKQ